MLVIAKAAGFYDGSRIRVGQEFEFDLAKGKRDKDGKPVLPSWVVPSSEQTRAELGDSRKAMERKNRDAAKASAGPKRGGGRLASAVQEDDLV